MTDDLDELYELQATFCKALANPVRLRILDLLSEGEKPNSELLSILNIPKANLSQHLGVLGDTGIIGTRKEGTAQWVFIALPEVKEACAMVKKLLLARLLEREQSSVKLKDHIRRNLLP